MLALMVILSKFFPQGKTAVQADIDAVAEAVDFLKFNHHYAKVLLISIMFRIKSFVITISREEILNRKQDLVDCDPKKHEAIVHDSCTK